MFLLALNWLFFGFVLVGALVGQYESVDFVVWPVGEEVFHQEIGVFPWLVLEIFLFNLFLSGFVLVTLSGLVFFALPVLFLLFRAMVWGVLLNGLPTPLFLFALPTLLLEGEGYVLAALAGVGLGLSWLKPKWAYKEEMLSRRESVMQALRDCLRIYVLVFMFLFVAAVVEASTMILAFQRF
jgi:hypothetical protein